MSRHKPHTLAGRRGPGSRDFRNRDFGVNDGEGVTPRRRSQVKEHFHHHNVDKDTESLRNEVTKVRKQIVSGEHIALHQRTELEKLSRIIQEAEEERQRQVR